MSLARPMAGLPWADDRYKVGEGSLGSFAFLISVAFPTLILSIVAL